MATAPPDLPARRRPRSGGDMARATVPTAAPSPRIVKAPAERRDEILAAARALFADRGIARTSISDIAEHVGITRGLIYHYFTAKDELVDAVLEQYIAEVVRDIRRWDAEREVGNIDKALVDGIALFRRHLSRDGAVPRIEDAGLYHRFTDRAVRAMVDCLQVTTVEAYAVRHTIRIEHVRETFYVLVHGLIALVRNTPAIADTTLAAIVRQTLHLDPSDPAVPAQRTTPPPHHHPESE